MLGADQDSCLRSLMYLADDKPNVIRQRRSVSYFKQTSDKIQFLVMQMGRERGRESESESRD
jgi:hypothetical protein